MIRKYGEISTRCVVSFDIDTLYLDFKGQHVIDKVIIRCGVLVNIDYLTLTTLEKGRGVSN